MGRRDLHPLMIRAQHSTQSAVYFQLHCGVCPGRFDGLALASRHLGAVPSSSRSRESTAGLLPFGDVNRDEQDVDHKQDPASTLLPSQGEFGDKARSSFDSTLLLLHFRLDLAGTCVASIEVAIFLPSEGINPKTSEFFAFITSPQPPRDLSRSEQSLFRPPPNISDFTNIHSP